MPVSDGGFQHKREALLTTLRRKGIRDEAVLAAIAAVPRERFVDEHLAESAYQDAPLPIGEGQTISQPYIVAVMTAALKLTPTAVVLEIGTGSGYAAAVLSRLAARVYTVERQEGLVRQARRRLKDLGCDNVEVKQGDGTLGWPEHAPYDAIVVTAGGPEPPPALLSQLRIGGRLVIPVGPQRATLRLLCLTRGDGDSVAEEDLGAVRFVPLIGVQGWQS